MPQINSRAGHALLLFAVLLTLDACIPGRVKELNEMGAKAIAARRYDLAVNYLSESLALYPDQPKVALQLDSAKVMLKQIYVTKIYDLVDGPVKPIGTFLNVWKMSAELPKLNVARARVASIRIDMNGHFTKAEKILRDKTEPHNYYIHLVHMHRLVPSNPVVKASHEVAGVLRTSHLEQRKRADAARLPGLALLHSAAAATFSPGDTGLWADAARRRNALLRQLGIPVYVEALSRVSAGNSTFLLGGLKRRLPRIFIVQAGAPLRLVLDAARPQPDQNVVNSRHSARCQVGVRREKNPLCDSLRRSTEMARRTYDQKLGALETARGRCSSAPQPNTCNSYLSSATRDVDSAKRHYENLERQVGRCPPFVDKPVYKIFFYGRSTITRRVTASGAVKVVRNGKVWRSRGVVGSAAAQDTYGEGLACARIPADPMSLPSLAQLKVQAEERMLDQSLSELLQMRREKSRDQMAGGANRDQRLDALVRARLVDESYKRVRQQLSANLTRMWAADFALPDRIVR